MKNLFIFILILGCAGLYFHDKQQTAHLSRAEADNAQLTQQLSAEQAAVASLQSAARNQAAAFQAQASAQYRPQPQYQPQSPYVPTSPGSSRTQQGLQTDHLESGHLRTDQLQGSGGLNRGAY